MVCGCPGCGWLVGCTKKRVTSQLSTQLAYAHGPRLGATTHTIELAYAVLTSQVSLAPAGWASLVGQVQTIACAWDIQHSWPGTRARAPAELQSERPKSVARFACRGRTTAPSGHSPQPYTAPPPLRSLPRCSLFPNRASISPNASKEQDNAILHRPHPPHLKPPAHPSRPRRPR